MKKVLNRIYYEVFCFWLGVSEMKKKHNNCVCL